MKRLFCLGLALLMLASFSCVEAADTIKITMNGVYLSTDVAPAIVNSRTMIPFRAIFEAVGAEVNWSDSLKKVYATVGEKTIILTIGSDKMVVNATVVPLDAPPFISNSRTLVPVRAVCEALDCTVSWDAEKRYVVIYSKSYMNLLQSQQSQQIPSTESSQPQTDYNQIIDNEAAYYTAGHTVVEQKVIDLVNAQRRTAGLSELQSSPSLAAVCYAHSMDMANQEYVSHTSPDGVTLTQRLDTAGISYTSAAENLASGFSTPEETVKSWMNSPSHKEAILNPEFTTIAAGYYAGGSNGTYWTLNLIS